MSLVDPLNGEEKLGDDVLKGLKNLPLRFVFQGSGLRPSGRYIHHGEGLSKISTGISTVVSDEIHLNQARRR